MGARARVAHGLRAAGGHPAVGCSLDSIIVRMLWVEFDGGGGDISAVSGQLAGVG